MNTSFETEMKTGFLEEAAQLLANAEQCFLSLENQPDNKEILESIFRIAHNIKGSARAVGFDALGAFTHEFESFLIQCKTGKIALDRNTISLLLKCNDHVNQWVEKLKSNHDALLSNDDLISEIQNFQPNSISSQISSTSDLSPDFTQDRAPVELLHQPEPPIFENSLPNEARTSETPNVSSASKAATSTEESIRVSLSRLEKLVNYIGEMVILQTVLNEQTFSGNSDLLRRTIQQMGKVTKEVQDLSMSLRMIPVKQTFQKMQRIVRDTSAALGKKVHLELSGEETEVDKTILEKLSDPLVHLIRNAVDHGIENPEMRITSGKSDTGTIQLRAFHQSGSLVIEIKDDGAGINAEKLRMKAREKGILSASATLSDKDATHLIFHSGFSTKEQVTDISGRGVGMDVVKTNIEELQGEIQIETTLGKGTCFRVKLPLTLAIIDGMIIRCQNERFVIPLSHVHESLRPNPQDIHFVSALGEVLTLRNEQIPLYRLASLFSPSASIAKPKDGTVIVVRTEAQAFSILVDDIIGQHQVVIKQLGKEHSNLSGISGSAILGDGKPALILELNDLIKRAKNQILRRTA